MGKVTRIRNATPGRSARRREELRRAFSKPGFEWREMLSRTEVLVGLAVVVMFIGTAAWLIDWSRTQPRIQVGQIATTTRVNRIDFTVQDELRTEEERRKARENAPHVFALNTPYVESLEAPLLNLPVLVAAQTAFAEISAPIRTEFDLNEAALEALRPYASEGKPTKAWQEWVEALIRIKLPEHPIIESTVWQNQLNRPAPPELRSFNGNVVASWSDAIQIRPESKEARNELRAGLEPVARAAGFPPAVSHYVSARLSWDPKPTYQFDREASRQTAEQAAELVAPVRIEHRKGELIVAAGDVLKESQRQNIEREAEWFAAMRSGALWLERLGIIGLITIISIFIAGYIAAFYPRITRNPMRMVAVGVMFAAMIALSVLVTARFPGLAFPAAITPPLLLAIVFLLAYDQRLALFLSWSLCGLTVLALEHSVGMFLLITSCCATAIGLMPEVRNRSSLIRATSITALVAGFGAIMLGMIEMPLVPGAWEQILENAMFAAFSSFAVGFLVLGVLPSIEKWFDITTGMTLAELRDPKQPLLRQLQQTAPGTYNHSVQTANIAEAAAEAIGANGLLVYVGALYHDIGKMNKPAYFIENQMSGHNKHDKLSPAMSLLVIVGHVKDGIELAREYGLPRAVQHFIESHHGTTLVEYFYHAAKTQAEAEDREAVQEFEFRYPGPKPRTKEAAILMLSDAVESATRALEEPNAGRIENLVRQMSRKRLLDGQFSQCDLTFRELNLIEDAIIKSVLAIHHGRCSYPGGKEDDEIVLRDETPTQPGVIIPEQVVTPISGGIDLTRARA